MHTTEGMFAATQSNGFSTAHLALLQVQSNILGIRQGLGICNAPYDCFKFRICSPRRAMRSGKCRVSLVCLQALLQVNPQTLAVDNVNECVIKQSGCFTVRMRSYIWEYDVYTLVIYGECDGKC